VRPRPPRAGFSPARSVAIANRHPRLRLDRRAVTRLIATLDAAAAEFVVRQPAFLIGELSLVFLTDAALAALHADFLDDPTPTDVITFEGESCPGLPAEAGPAGEICVSVDTAARYARANDREFSAELSLYLVHGWLHLAGYDDLVPAKKRVMRRAERRAMRILERAGAIPRFVLRAPRARSVRGRG
jgi:probable rRNA maturation factor